MCKWRVGDRCIVTIPTSYPRATSDSTKDVLGFVSHIEHRANSFAGNLYTIRLDNPIQHRDGVDGTLLEYTSKNMRKIVGGLR